MVVSETAPEVTSPGGPPKLLGMNRTTVYIIGAAAVAGLGWYLYQRHKAASSTAAGTQTGTTGECTDANGNPTPCEDMAGVDYSGQLSVMQTELESLAASEGNEATPTTPAPTTTTTTPPKTTPAAPTQASRYNAPATATLSKVNGTTLQCTFTMGNQPQPAPSSATVALYQQNGKLVGQQTVSIPDETGGRSGCTFSGLHASWCYHANVWANGGKSAPPNKQTGVQCV